MSNSQKYFDPETLARIKSLGLRARTLIEGFVAGLHRSPSRGHSIEFAQHREYAAGDDLRQVDWKVFARSDRYYVKQYEDETALTCYMVLDQSESMTYQGRSSHLSKLEYAQLVACSLMYLVISQRDRAGLLTFTDHIDDWLAPSSSPSQLDDAIRILERSNADKTTRVGSVLNEAVRRIDRPAVLILLSDLLEDESDLEQALKLVRHAGHDLVVLHILDSDEIDFSFEQTTEFEGLEDLPSITADPLLIAGAYRKAMSEFRSSVEYNCRSLNCDYFCIRTDEPLSVRLPQILATRLGRRS